MNIGQLRKLLEGKPDHLEVVLSKSFEGDVGSMLVEMSIAKFIPCKDNDFNNVGYFETANSKTANCVVFIPKV